MADRDRYDWERGRDFDRDRDRGYGRGGERNGNFQDRGMVSRGADEVRSWFGDDDARHRREMDEQRERQQWPDRGQRDYGANSERARSEHGWASHGERPEQGWSNQGQRPDTAWESQRGQSTGYGDQRDFIGRSSDWRGNQPPDYDRGSHWTGGSRDYGDEDTRRRYGNWQPTGGFAAGQPGSSFSGGYGAGNYQSGNYPGRSSYGQSESGGYGREFGATTGEGRWSGGGMFSGRGPRSYQRSDDRVREDVNERLTIDSRIDASDIDVRVQNGEVTLSGTVDARRTRRLAEEIIEDLPGVRDVHNELRVQRTNDWSQQGGSHRQVGEQSRTHEDGSIGKSGDPQRRDDVTTVNVKDGEKR